VPFDYSVTNLLQSIRDVSNVGPSNQDWPDAKILRLVNREVMEYLVPMIRTARNGHFATYQDVPLVGGQAAYPIPSKAVGMGLRADQLVDANGVAYSRVIEDELESVINYSGSWSAGPTPTGVPSRFYFRGNSVVLFPVPSGTPALSLRLYFDARPSALALNASCIQITSFPAGAPAGSYRLGFSGTAPGGYTAAIVCDLVQNVPGFDVLQTVAISATNAAYLEFVGTRPAQLLVGDWICLTDTAPVVTGAIPEIVVGCLIEKVALKVMSGKADDAAFNRQARLLKKDEESARNFLKRRNTGDRPKAGTGALHRFRRG
jgi:hypothetical protein